MKGRNQTGNEVRYGEIIEAARSIILHFDTEGRLTYVNRFALEFFGYAPEELLGHNVVGTIVPETETSGRDLAHMVADLETRPELYTSNENENMRANGERVWVNWSNGATRNAAGELTGVVSVGNDISLRKYAEDEQRAKVHDLTCMCHIANALASTADPRQSLNEVAAVISTELMFPMAAVELHEPSRDVMVVLGAHGGDWGQFPWDSGHTPSGWVVKNNREFIETHALSKPQYEGGVIDQLRLQTYVSVPMRLQERVIGALTLGDPREVGVDENLPARAMDIAGYLAKLLAFGGVLSAELQ